MLEKLRPDNLSRDIAIDFGTASVLVYVEGKGIVLKEPSVVAIDVPTDRVVKVGQDAMEMLGRTPEHLQAIRPMKNGVVSQYEVTLQMLKYFIRRACGKLWIPPRVMICVPTGITEVEMRAIMDASREAGARRTYLIEEPRAAALGAGLDIRSPRGSMVVNIGGGVSNVAVMSMGGVVVSDSIRIGGDKFDEAIANYVRRRYNILIGERTAEDIKIGIGEVYEHRKPQYMKVTGRSLSDGLPKEVLLSSKEMIEALAEPITAILDSICTVIEQTPPELVGDILQSGIMMTGGGSLLRGLDQLIERVTNIPTYVAKKPISSIVLGAGSLLPHLNGMPEGMVTIPPRTK
jgi:rod shape-determining protein MreB